MSPLPHHRAYGSVPRRFGGWSNHQFTHRKQAQTTEAGLGEGAMPGFGEAQPPRSLRAEDGGTGRPLGDLEATEFAVGLAARFPLDPGDPAKLPPDPAVQRCQLVPLTQTEVAGPSPARKGSGRQSSAPD
jgi:hypothetical protein